MRFIDGTTILLALPAATAVMTALVYRGTSACGQCPESVGRLLENCPYHFNVKYVGPDEDVDLSPELLSKANVYVYPGGPG
jgi:hypothetical protein